MVQSILKNSFTGFLALAICLAPMEKASADYDVPGDSRIVELLYEMRYLTDHRDPNFVMIWGTLFSFFAVHSLARSIGELRAERFELIRKARELKLEQAAREALTEQIERLSQKLAEVEHRMQAANVELNGLVSKLSSHADKGADEKLANRIKKITAYFEQDRAKPINFFRTTDTFLNSAQGKKFLDSAEGKQWQQLYTKQRDAYVSAQSDFMQHFEQAQRIYEEFSDKQMGSVHMPRQGDYKASVYISDEHGVTLSRLAPEKAVKMVENQLSMCRETLERLARKRSELEREASPLKYYTSAPNRAFLRGPITVAAGSIAGTAGVYAYIRNQRGSDPLHYEIERQANFGVWMSTKMDLLSQLSSTEGKKNMAGIYSAFNHALAHEKTQLVDAVSESLRKLDMGHEPTMKIASALEDSVTVNAAIDLAIVKASRTNGLYGLNREQVLLLMNPKFTAVPEQWRQNFVADIVHETIKQIWNVPGADVAMGIPAHLKLTLKDSFLKHLREEAERGHLNIQNPEMVLSLPGAGTLTKEQLGPFISGSH